jgi:hypothetical protein
MKKRCGGDGSTKLPLSRHQAIRQRLSTHDAHNDVQRHQTGFQRRCYAMLGSDGLLNGRLVLRSRLPPRALAAATMRRAHCLFPT